MRWWAIAMLAACGRHDGAHHDDAAAARSIDAARPLDAAAEPPPRPVDASAPVARCDCDPPVCPLGTALWIWPNDTDPSGDRLDAFPAVQRRAHGMDPDAPLTRFDGEVYCARPGGTHEGPSCDHDVTQAIAATYHDDELDGPYVSCWDNGTPDSRGTYRRGARDGHWVFYDHGAIDVEGDYQGGKPMSPDLPEE